MGGLIAGGGHEPSERRLAREYADAWEREDYARMYSMLTAPARAETSPRSFARQYRRARRDRDARPPARRRPHSVREESVTVPFMADTRSAASRRGHAAAGRG